MCGVFGFLTNEKHAGDSSRVRFCANAMIAGAVRGEDGAGLAMVFKDTSKRTDIIRTAGGGWDLVNDALWYDPFVAKSHTLRAVMGHNRAATKGKVSVENSHPFSEGPITLMHNGTLISTADMPIPMHKAPKGIEVDSHLIAHNLAHHRVEEVIKSLDGAFTLAWHDQRDGAMRFIRNAQRPLFFMPVKCESTILYASEPDMLWWLAGRNGFTRGPIFGLSEGVLATWMPKDIHPRLRKLELYVWKSTNRSNFWAGDPDDWLGYNRTAPVKAEFKEDKPKEERPSEGKFPKITAHNKARLEAMGVPLDRAVVFELSSAYRQPGSDVNTANGFIYWLNKKGKACNSQALIYGVTDAFLARQAGMDWMVCPVATRPIRDAKTKESAEVVVAVTRGLQPKVKPPSKIEQAEATVASYKGPGNVLLTKKDWLLITSKGCFGCGQPLHPHQSQDCYWVGTEDCMCPSCVKEAGGSDDNGQVRMN